MTNTVRICFELLFLLGTFFSINHYDVFALPSDSFLNSYQKITNTEFSVGSKTENCSSGWYITGYFTPHENDYSGQLTQVLVNGVKYQFKMDFIDNVKMEGWGKTSNHNYLGYWDDSFHFSNMPLDSNGNELVRSIIATDTSFIPHGSKVLIPTLPPPWNELVFTSNDVGPAIIGKHIDVYTGEGKTAEQKTFEITGYDNSICIVDEIIHPYDTGHEVTKNIPEWIKNNIQWWINNGIDDQTFINGIQFLIQKDIIRVENILETSIINEQIIPDWIKITAGFWAKDQITEKEFIQALQWLIEHNILRITPIPTSTVPSVVQVAGWWSTQLDSDNPFSHNQTNPEYWISVGQEMSSRFNGSVPGGILVIGYIQGSDSATKTFMPFPKPNGLYPNVNFGNVDTIDPLLTAYDEAGLKIYLQVEPADADIPMLMDLIMKKYKHHPSVIGFGVDVEWYHQSQYPGWGRALTDQEVNLWANKVKTYNPNYDLILTHWDPTYLSNSRPSNVVFLTDSERIGSLSAAIGNYTSWVDHFSPSKVGFHIGYPSDMVWWSKLTDPAYSMINPVLTARPEAKIGGVFWVHFTVEKEFPPK